jgi:hypothetical protein
VGNPLVNAYRDRFHRFIQADWRAALIVTLGFGARYIAQSNLHDQITGATASIGIQAAKRNGDSRRRGCRIRALVSTTLETILWNSRRPDHRQYCVP